MTGKKHTTETASEVKMQEHKQKAAHKVGDAIEKAGDKLQEMGATKAGAKVREAGDKLEHSQDFVDEDGHGNEISDASELDAQVPSRRK